MAKMYTLDEKLLVGTPEIRIGDKVYPVDDRQKTVKKILNICEKNSEKNDINMVDEVLKLAFTAEDFKTIDKLDLSWKAYQELFQIVISAVTGQDKEDIEERFQGEEK